MSLLNPYIQNNDLKIYTNRDLLAHKTIYFEESKNLKKLYPWGGYNWIFSSCGIKYCKYYGGFFTFLGTIWPNYFGGPFGGGIELTFNVERKDFYFNYHGKKKKLTSSELLQAISPTLERAENLLSKKDNIWDVYMRDLLNSSVKININDSPLQILRINFAQLLLISVFLKKDLREIFTF